MSLLATLQDGTMLKNHKLSEERISKLLSFIGTDFFYIIVPFNSNFYVKFAIGAILRHRFKLHDIFSFAGRRLLT